MNKKYIENSRDYWVTDEGRIFRGERELKKNRQHQGYVTVTITYMSGERKVKFVHRLVAEYFIPNPESKPLVNHINLVKNDNRVENLEWVTHQENNRHAHENGAFRAVDGRHHHAKYPDELIHKVCEMIQEGRRSIDIQKKCLVDRTTIYNIRKKKVWMHISNEYVFEDRPRWRRLSDPTVKWVCHKILEGYTPRQIESMSKGKVPYHTVKDIKQKKCYCDISDNFF